MSGHLARLEEAKPLTGSMQISLMASSSFGSPWRCNIEVFGDNAHVDMIAWNARGRSEFGSSELAMYRALDRTPPIEERGVVLAAAPELASLRTAARLGTIVQCGILDGWRARLRYADEAHANEFELRCDLRSTPEHAQLLRTLVDVALRALHATASLRALELFADVPPLPRS